MQRRDLLLGAAAAGIGLAAPVTLRAATGPRVFDLYRGRSRIGQQTLTVSPDGGRINVAIDINIKVRILGLPAYSYQLASRETWGDGTLLRLDATANDNGTAHRVSALRTGGALTVDGTAFRGQLSGNPGTTTYWSEAFLRRNTWVSTQDGTPMNVSASKGGAVSVPTPEGQVNATRWQVRGDIGRLDLFFDTEGEWVGNEFDARGEQARFVLAARGRPLANLRF